MPEVRTESGLARKTGWLQLQGQPQVWYCMRRVCVSVRTYLHLLPCRHPNLQLLHWASERTANQVKPASHTKYNLPQHQDWLGAASLLCLHQEQKDPEWQRTLFILVHIDRVWSYISVRFQKCNDRCSPLRRSDKRIRDRSSHAAKHAAWIQWHAVFVPWHWLIQPVR